MSCLLYFLSFEIFIKNFAVIRGKATRWGIASAGNISSDYVTALKLLPEEEHRVRKENPPFWSCNKIVFVHLFLILYLNFLEAISPFSGPTYTHVLDFCWHLFESYVWSFTCILHCLCKMDSSDSLLVQHLLTSWRPGPREGPLQVIPVWWSPMHHG